MLYAGLDLSRKRLDFHLLDAEGATVEVGAPAGRRRSSWSDSAARASWRADPRGDRIDERRARFVYDRLELAGWRVETADAQKVKGLAPLACKTDRIDAWVLAELARPDLVPAIWLPDPRVRAERERARWRLHLVRHRSSLKQRIQPSCSPTASPAPSPISSACAAASWSQSSGCRSLGKGRGADRPRAPIVRGHLAHAQPRRTIRSQRRHRPRGRVTVLKEMRHRSGLQSALSSD
jgi:hypothetical protein